ncbi:hypothetical protein HC028_05260 [Planosporangium flavigriseum]|nr:hypothetical protein [Planosporangium flavigriseum]NJC63917.1 hypothetical protein [Planosporangium flavigriseum]
MAACFVQVNRQAVSAPAAPQGRRGANGPTVVETSASIYACWRPVTT